MCLTIPLDRFKILQANRPITVFKIISKLKDGSYLAPTMRGFSYKRGSYHWPSIAKFGITPDFLYKRRLSVFDGLHSFSTLSRAKKSGLFKLRKGMVIVQMEIPQGYYYIKDNGRVVSNSLYFPKNSKEIK